MESITIDNIKNYVNGKFINKISDSFLLFISIDSREVNSDSLFIPIIGENLDGHNFMENAYLNGCRNFLIDENHSFNKNDINLIKVKDTTIAFGDIAKNYKNIFNPITIGVTGSVGKTSTKDMIYEVVNEEYKTLKNEGNLNNEIGIPKTLLNLDKTYEVAVVEMGLSYKGDIEYFASIVNPKIAVISNIGLSHIENFKDQEGIFEAKMEITFNFNSSNVLIVNGDDNYLKKLKDKNLKYKLLTYGFSSSNNIYCENYKINNTNIEFTCIINKTKEKFVIPTIAKHNILNAMSAILVGMCLNISLEKIKKGLSKFEITKGRLSIIEKKEITIIDDSYNASMDSMISALNVLKNYKTRRVAVLGDILETGSYTKLIHEGIGNNIYGNADILIAVSKNSKIYGERAIENGMNKENIYYYDNVEQLIKNIDNIIKKNDTILIKASHGINLSFLVTYLDDKYE